MSKQQPDFYDVYIQEHWRKTLAEEPIYDASMNILILMLIKKLEEIVPDFDYLRFYSYFIRHHCSLKEPTKREEEIKDIIEICLLPLSNLTFDQLCEYILEFARYMGRKRFIACLNELRSCGSIEDPKGRLDTTAFAQVVNDCLFLNEVNFNRFIVNLYPDDDTSYPRYLESLKK